jgi:hypothetical protein
VWSRWFLVHWAHFWSRLLVLGLLSLFSSIALLCRTRSCIPITENITSWDAFWRSSWLRNRCNFVTLGGWWISGCWFWYWYWFWHYWSWFTNWPI